jgi:hypothetical protein
VDCLDRRGGRLHKGRLADRRVRLNQHTTWFVARRTDGEATSAQYAIASSRGKFKRDRKVSAEAIVERPASTDLKKSYMRFKTKLLDVIDLSIHPVVVGRGTLLFREGESTQLKLVATKSFSRIVKLTYEPQY